MSRRGLAIGLTFALASTVAFAQPGASVHHVLNRCLAVTLADASCFGAIDDYVDALGQSGVARAAKDAAIASLAARLEAEATDVIAARVASAITIMAQSVEDPEVFDALEATSIGIIDAFTRTQPGSAYASRA